MLGIGARVISLILLVREQGWHQGYRKRIHLQSLAHQIRLQRVAALCAGLLSNQDGKIGRESERENKGVRGTQAKARPSCD